MRSQLRTMTTAATAALVLFALLAPSAHAGSLLSGYGGPGQGSQAILGSALLNGAGGGEGGGGSAGSSGSQGSAAPATGIALAEGGSKTGGGRSAGGSAKGTTGGGSAGAGAKAPAPVRTAPEAAVSTPPLGISGAELLYILPGLGGLAVTGVLTRQLTRRP